jgi:D-alanyl-lipoteichoic acid acyltransferase DltB (MBOAT superfamily)
VSVVSPGFAAFVAVVLSVYYALPPRTQRWWLLGASYVFYAWWGWHLALLLAVATVSHHVVAARVGSSAAWFWTAVGLDVAGVALLRHTGALGFGAMIGVSFWAMQAISYLADVRSGALRGRGGLVDVALYLAYFPKLVLGPIERASGFLPRLAAPRIVDDAAIARATARILEGLVRKLVLADPVAALVVADAFEAPERVAPGALVASVVAAVFALYNDFAGYTSIVRGVSDLFGIELAPNFLQPLFSRSFTEFWTRWHVSLSRWLRDYVYLPCARALLRRDPRPRNVPAIVVPPMAAMVASGFWHGGSSGMMLWGALHGVFLTVERLWSVVRPRRRASERPLAVQLFQMLAVFVLGTLAFVPFRAGSVSAAMALWAALLRPAGWALPPAALVVVVGATLLMDTLERRTGDPTAVLAWPRPARAAALALAVLLVFLASRAAPPAPFVYQNF